MFGEWLLGISFREKHLEMQYMKTECESTAKLLPKAEEKVRKNITSPANL